MSIFLVACHLVASGGRPAPVRRLPPRLRRPAVPRRLGPEPARTLPARTSRTSIWISLMPRPAALQHGFDRPMWIGLSKPSKDSKPCARRRNKPRLENRPPATGHMYSTTLKFEKRIWWAAVGLSHKQRKIEELPAFQSNSD